MRSTLRQLFGSVLVAIILSGPVWATQGDIAWAFPFHITVVSKSMATGQVTLEIKVRHGGNILCDPVSVNLTGTSGVRWEGPSSWELPGLTAEWHTQVLNLTVPIGDTSGFIMWLTCPKGKLDIRTFFVTTGDTIETFNGDPRESPPYPTMPKVGPPIGNVQPGEFPLDDSLWGIIQLSKETFPKTAGPAKIRLRFAPAKHPCDSLKFSAAGINGLKIAGDHTWTAPMVGAVPYERELEIVVPPNDTSGIRVEMQCSGAHHELEQYFVATEKGVTCFAWDQVGPRWRPQHKKLTLTQELRELYPTPLTEASEQVISFRKKDYVRYRGEIDFVEVWYQRGDQATMDRQYRDSSNSIPMTAQFDIELLVPDSAALRKAQAIVPDCKYFGREENYDLYNCHVSKATVIRLQEQRVPFRYVASELHPIRQDTATTIELPVRDSMKAHIKPVGLRGDL